MIKEVSRWDLFWGYAAQILNMGAGFLLIPVVLYFLSPADVGLWFVFVTLASLSQLLEFGFQPTLARNVAFVFSGAKTLVSEGLPPESEKSGIVDIQLLQGLITASQKIYRIISLLAIVFLIFAGTMYITTLLTLEQDQILSIFAWLLFATGQVLTFYFGYFNALLQGRGDVLQANKVIVITRISMITFAIILMFMDLGLLGLGISSMLSAAVGRLVASYYFKSEPLSYQASISKFNNDSPKLLKILWHNSRKTALVQLGAFLIQRGNVLIASSFLGVVTTAAYSLTMTILMAISTVAGVVCQIQMPYLSHLQIKGDQIKLASLYWRIVLSCLLLYAVGVVTIFLFGEQFLILVRSQVNFLPDNLFLICALIIMLEMHHALAATYLTTMNYIPFVRAAFVSGLAVLAISLLLIKPMGLIGLIIAQGIVQLAYNNWKWPLTVYECLYKRKPYGA